MLNTKLVAERIGKIIKENNLSASSFAKMIGVQDHQYLTFCREEIIQV